jgi:CheY-like chemotaxis protein
MDIQMPEMDGFEAVARLRQQNYRKPVIALTAHAMKGDRERCIQGGFDNYLVKPINQDHLKKTLLQYSSPAERPESSPHAFR